MLTVFYNVEMVSIKDGEVRHMYLGYGFTSRSIARQELEKWFNRSNEPVDCELFRRRVYVNTNTQDYKLYECIEVWNDGEVRRYTDILRIIKNECSEYRD